MDSKELQYRSESHESIIVNEEYFKYIFKKTEKIACAVFYITRSLRNIDRNDTVIVTSEDAASRLIDASLKALRATSVSRRVCLEDVGYALIALESVLRIMQAARLLPEEHLSIFIQEIDAVERTIRRYLKDEIVNPLFEVASQKELVPVRKQRVEQTRRLNEEARPSAPVAVVTRRDRIIAILKDIHEGTIKDISGHIADCSEKTIQRELIDLIKDNVVLREGERRWSRYKLVV